VAAGSYGIASAASGSGSSGSSGAAATTQEAPAPQQRSRQPWDMQRSDETPLTGADASKAEAAAKAKVPGATIVRVETDADGNAKYEAHIVQSDGTPATVYLNESFEVVSVEAR
jgi:uncharacterized membrane protein YkoI